MQQTTTRADPVHVACEVCLSEVPASEVRHSEAGDYVLHFCGIECYRLWRALQERNES